MGLTTRPLLRLHTVMAFLTLLVALPAAAQVTVTPIQSIGSLSAYARWSSTEPLASQSNFFTPADPLAPFDVAVEAYSADIRNPATEARSFATVSARWQSAAQGRVDMSVGWRSNGISDGQLTFSRSDDREGWTYVLRTDVDALFVLNLAQVIDPAATTSAGVSQGFYIELDDQYVTNTGLLPVARLELPLSAGQPHKILLRSRGGVAGNLGTNQAGLEMHVDWAITSAVPELPSWALMLAALPALVLRRRLRPDR